MRGHASTRKDGPSHGADHCVAARCSLLRISFSSRGTSFRGKRASSGESLAKERAPFPGIAALRDLSQKMPGAKEDLNKAVSAHEFQVNSEEQ